MKQHKYNLQDSLRQTGLVFDNYHLPGCQKALGAALIGFAVLASSGCGNSSNIENRKEAESQAIDGYIVNAAVFCDGIRNGRTQAAGGFDCPSPTNVAQVVGGMDVGFDKNAISGGIPFFGELKSPGGAPFVTPLSTLATNLASNDGTFDPSLYEGAVETLAESLDLEFLDLEESPADNLSLAKANAKVNQLIVNFADSSEEYAIVIDQLAKALTGTAPPRLDAGATTLVSALNERLAFAAPELSVTPEEQVAIAQALQALNAAIDASGSPMQMGNVIERETGASPYVFTIDRSAPLVRFGSPDDQTVRFFNLREFGTSTLGLFGYNVNKGPDAKSVEFATSAFDVRQSVTNADVDLAIEFTSTDPADERHISIIMYGAKLSMTEGVSSSVQISVPEDTLLFAQAMDEAGVITNVTTQAGDDYFSTNANGNFSFAFSTLDRELSDRGYYNFTQEDGNYEVTMVISGLGFGIEETSGAITDPTIHTVKTTTRTVTGNGLHGYFTTR